MLNENRRSKRSLGGNGFGMACYQVDVEGTRPRTSDFDNPSAFGGVVKSKRDLMEGKAFGFEFTQQDLRDYMKTFNKQFYRRVQSMQDYDGSVEANSKEFAVFFSYQNVYYLVSQLKKRSGSYPDADDLFEKMLNMISQSYSTSSDVTSVDREDRSDARILRHNRSLNFRVLQELSFELRENSKLWDTYARNMNYRYDSFEQPILVTNKDDGYFVSGDFLLPE